jgi:YfiR/HmsC-like
VPAVARGQGGAEAHVKARIAFNLARFTQWPAQAFADATSPQHWCASLRDAALARALEALGTETAGGRGIQAQINAGGSVRGCHVLYIEAAAERSAVALLAEAANTPVLTIGDGDGFSQRGIVGLVNVNDSIRFDVNLTRMRAAQLNISSQVLKLARRVHE